MWIEPTGATNAFLWALNTNGPWYASGVTASQLSTGDYVVTFADVAGVEEAKEEVVEIVSPERVLFSGEADMVITRTLGGGAGTRQVSSVGRHGIWRMVDGGTPTPYDVELNRLLTIATYPANAQRTVAIDHATLTELCGDDDGCGSPCDGSCPAGETFSGPLLLYLQQAGVGGLTVEEAGTQTLSVSVNGEIELSEN